MKNKEKFTVDKYYFNSPEIWDKMIENKNRFKKEANIILNIIKEELNRNEVSLLDVGCGTGGHFDYFLKKNIKCSGIDLNSKMIDYAKKKFPNLDLRVMDMRNMNFDRVFDVLICFNSTFLYNLTNEDIIKSLSAFNKALNSSGIVIIDFSEQISYIYQRAKEDPKLGCVYDINTPDFHAQVIVKTTFDPILQVTYGTREFIFDDGNRIKENVKYRKLFAQEFKYFLKSNGFEEIKFRLSEENRALTPQRLITIAKK